MPFEIHSHTVQNSGSQGLSHEDQLSRASQSWQSQSSVADNDQQFNWGRIRPTRAYQRAGQVLSDPMAQMNKPNPKVSLLFASDGARLPVLGQGATRVFVANAGAANCNIPAFYSWPERQSIIGQECVKDEADYGARSLLLAGAVDAFIAPHGVRSKDHAQRSFELTAITAKAAHISVPKNIKVVPTLSPAVDEPYDPIDRLAQEMREQHVCLQSQILEPHLLEQLLPNSCQNKSELLEMAYNNLAGYRKDASEQLWRSDGLPTPNTVYLDANKIKGDLDLNQKLNQIKNDFQQYENLVVSRVDGSGGEFVSLIKTDDLCIDTLGLKTETLMIQGCLPLINSPNIIANINEHDRTILLATDQIFERFGVYAGNRWPCTSCDMEAINVLADKALLSLQKVGIRGQVNIDILEISQDSQEQLGLPSRLFLREVNTRPACSSILLPVLDQAHTPRGHKPAVALMTSQVNAFKIPLEETETEQNLLAYLCRRINHEGIGVIVTQYNVLTGQAGIILFGDESISFEQLQCLIESLNDEKVP